VHKAGGHRVDSGRRRVREDTRPTREDVGSGWTQGLPEKANEEVRVRCKPTREGQGAEGSKADSGKRWAGSGEQQGRPGKADGVGGHKHKADPRRHTERELTRPTREGIGNRSSPSRPEKALRTGAHQTDPRRHWERELTRPTREGTGNWSSPGRPEKALGSGAHQADPRKGWSKIMIQINMLFEVCCKGSFAAKQQTAWGAIRT
jgi:hypothetical protein